MVSMTGDASSSEAMFHIRQGLLGDIPQILDLDDVTRSDPALPAFIERVIIAGECYLAEMPHGVVVGYVVLDYTFYKQGFVSQLYVGQGYRRLGAGTLLMKHLEGLCATPKLFTSTNLSNTAMQGLLSRLGYQLSGVIEHLDEGDPELVYVKFLKPQSEGEV